MAKFNPVPTGQVEDTTQQRPLSQPRGQQSGRRRSSEFSRGLDSGIHTMRSIRDGLFAAGGAVVGADEFAEDRLQSSAEHAQRAQTAGPRITDIHDVHSLEDVTDYLQGLVGQQLPIMATLAVGGPTALTARALVAQQISKKAAFTAGVGAAGSGIGMGSIFPEVVEEAEESGNNQSLRESAFESAPFAVASGAMDAMPIARVFDRMGLGAAARSTVHKSMPRRIAEGAAETAVLEAGTEGAQTVVERSARKFVNDNFEIFDEEGKREIINAMASGGIIGGMFGGASGIPNLNSVDKEILDIEGESQLNTARAKAQADRLRDIPELAEVLEDYDIIGYDDPTVQEDIGILGASYNKSLRGPASTQYIIKANSKRDDISTEEADFIRDVALGNVEMGAEVRDVLRKVFGSDSAVDSVLERIFVVETNRPPEDFEHYIGYKKDGAILDESELFFLPEYRGLAEDADMDFEERAPRFIGVNETTEEDAMRNKGTPIALDASDITGIAVDQEGNEYVRNQPLVRQASGKRVPGVFQMEQDGQTFDIPSFNLVNRMLVKHGIFPRDATVNQIAKAWFAGVGSLMLDNNYTLIEPSSLKASDKIFMDMPPARLAESKYLNEIMKVIGNPEKVRELSAKYEGKVESPIFDSLKDGKTIKFQDVKKRMDEVRASGRSVTVGQATREFKSPKIDKSAMDSIESTFSEIENRDPKEFRYSFKNLLKLKDKVDDPNTLPKARAAAKEQLAFSTTMFTIDELVPVFETIRGEFKGHIPREIEEVISDPYLKDLVNEKLDDMGFFAQDNTEGPASGFDTLIDKFNNQELSVTEANQLFNKLIEDERNSNFKPTRGTISVPPGAETRVNMGVNKPTRGESGRVGSSPIASREWAEYLSKAADDTETKYLNEIIGAIDDPKKLKEIEAKYDGKLRSNLDRRKIKKAAEREKHLNPTSGKEWVANIAEKDRKAVEARYLNEIIEAFGNPEKVREINAKYEDKFGSSVLESLKGKKNITFKDVKDRLDEVNTFAKEATQIVEAAVNTADEMRAPFYGAMNILGRPYMTKNEVDKVTAMHEKEKQLLKKWSDMLGLEVAPNLVSPTEILMDPAVKSVFGSSIATNNVSYGIAVDKGSTGLITDFRTKTGFIALNPANMNQAHRIEVLAHELGHLVLGQYFARAKASGALEGMYKEWLNWRKDKYGSSIGEAMSSRATFNAVQGMINEQGVYDPSLLMPLHKLDPDQANYVLDFQEWFADNAARWFTTSAKPQGAIEQFFHDIAQMFKKLYDAIRGEGHYAAKSVSDFLDSIVYRDKPAIYRSLNVMSMNEMAAIIEQDTGNAQAAMEQAGNMLAGINFSKSPDSPYTTDDLIEIFRKKLSPEDRASLARTFSARYVRNQLVKIFDRDYPAEMSRILADPELAMAYGFQLWSADMLDIGTETNIIFDVIKDQLYEDAGLVNDSANAKRIFAAIKDRTIGTGQVVIHEVNRESRMKRGFKTLGAVYDRLAPIIHKYVNSADGALHATKSPFLIEIANMINARVGDSAGVPQTMHEGKRENIGGYINRWHNIYNKIPDAETKNRVIELLQNPEAYKEARRKNKGSKEVQIATSIKNLLRRFYKDYYSKKDKSVGFRDDFFPWVFDPKYMQEHVLEFKQFLMKANYREEFDNMAKSINETRLASHNMWREDNDHEPVDTLPEDQYVSVEDVINRIINNIMGSGGLVDVELNLDKQHIPFMASANERTLAFLMEKGDKKDKAFMAKFFSKELDHTLMTYIHQSVKRAEFVSRFGQQGEKISDLIMKAREYGATDDDVMLAGMYIDGAMGTLGSRTNEWLNKKFGYEAPPGQVINPMLRKAIGVLMVVQNLAILSLATFTSLVDPVGIAVRGGDMKTATAALRTGYNEIIAKMKGDRTKLRQLGEAMGTIESKLSAEALEWEYGGTWLDPQLKWVNEQFFKTIGLTQLTRLTRLMALGGAEAFLKTHMDRKGEHSVRYMQELGLKEGDVVLNESGEVVVLTNTERDYLMMGGRLEEVARDDRVRTALNRFVDESIMRPNSSLRPIWASDPHFALIFHLKSFMYAFNDRILRRVASELDEGNVAPLLYLGAFVPGMMAADLLRDLLKAALGDENAFNPNKDMAARMENAIQRSGITGLGQMLIDAQNDVQFGGVGIESFLGPTAQNFLFKLDDLFFDADRGRWDALQSNMPFSNSLGIPIERLFLDEAIEKSDKLYYGKTDDFHVVLTEGDMEKLRAGEKLPLNRYANPYAAES